VSVALVIQNAMRMHHTTLPPVACRVVPHFSTSLKNGTILEKKNLSEHKMCFDFLYKFV